MKRLLLCCSLLGLGTLPMASQAHQNTGAAQFHYSEGLSSFFLAKGEMPFVAANENSLRTIGLNWGITVFR